jgi:predicted Zn-dependent peptidase
VLAGDLDPDKTALLAEKYFGGYSSKPVPPFNFEPQPVLAGPIHKDVFGQEAAYVELHWRFDGVNSNDALMLSLLRGLLYNRRAGLLDLNLLQKQQVLEANASSTIMEDYSAFRLYAKPREGQTLEEAEKLLLQQVEALKNGEFEEWLIEAVIKDFKLSEMRRNESNPGRVSAMTNAFILGLPWEKYVKQFDEMAGISKAEVVQFAKDKLRNNYLCIYKRTGDDPNVLKMEKPAITPVSVNRTASSGFAEAFVNKEAPRLQPVFLDYKNQIRTQDLGKGVSLDYIFNPTNPTFSLNYIVEMGRNNDPILALAISYLPYLGTDQFSSEQLKQEFFRLGLAFNVSVSNERMYVSLSGLDESFEAGVKLFEHVLANVKGDEEALKNLVADILVKRVNSTKDKRVILRQAMFNYARYGEKNPFTDIIPEETLKGIRSEELVERIKSLTGFEHRVFYFGSLDQNQVAGVLNRHHKTPPKLQPIGEAVQYPEQDQAQTEVLFVDFPMVQAEILWLSKGTPNFNLEEFVMANLYNEYFGSGLSSIVFQEIRESKALAYSAYAAYTSPAFEDQAHYIQAYVGTQVDKLADAVPAMVDIVENMPVSEAQIENARQAILRKIETERVIKDDIYWSYRFAKQRGLDRDVRQDVYQRMQSISPQDLIKFQQENVKGRKYTLLVMGSKDRVDMDFLRSIGPVKEMNLSEIFGFEVKP